MNLTATELKLRECIKDKWCQTIPDTLEMISDILHYSELLKQEYFLLPYEESILRSSVPGISWVPNKAVTPNISRSSTSGSFVVFLQERVVAGLSKSDPFNLKFNAGSSSQVIDVVSTVSVTLATVAGFHDLVIPWEEFLDSSKFKVYQLIPTPEVKHDSEHTV